MAGVIITDPSDKQMEKARALWNLMHGTKGNYSDDVMRARLRDGQRGGVNTSVSKRMFEKRAAERAMRPEEISRMVFIPWDRIAKGLESLNKTMRFTQLPDGKIALGFMTPSRKEVEDWEKAILSPEDRREVMRLANSQGPRKFLVPANRGWTAPYTDLLSKGMPVEIIARSLKSILGVLIAHGGFTWDAAEREFGFRLLGPGTEVQKKFMDITPKAWAETRPFTRL